jgi:hypothetical protein
MPLAPIGPRTSSPLTGPRPRSSGAWPARQASRRSSSPPLPPLARTWSFSPTTLTLPLRSTSWALNPPSPKQLRAVICELLRRGPNHVLAYHIAVRKECDVDQPRNLAKSVTVE